MKKYPKIKYLGSAETKGIFDKLSNEVVVQEKIDGANFRFMIKDGNLTFGSRNVAQVENKNYDQFANTIEYLEESIDEPKIDRDLVYVGEATQKHTLEYDWEEIPQFLGFDVLHKDSGLPLSWGIAKEKFDKIGLDFVPILWRGEVRKWKNKDMQTFLDSSEYRDGKPEGIVIKNYERLNNFDKPLFAKVKIEEFREKAKAKFGDNKAKRTNTAYAVEKYLTESRIRKIILKMTEEEGKELARPLMEDLIYRVAEDILDEHIVDLYREKKVDEIDFNVLNKMVPDKCLETIDKMMEEKATEK